LPLSRFTSRPAPRGVGFAPLSMALLLAAFSFFGPAQGPLHAQESDRTRATATPASGASTPGVSIPIQLEGLEDAHTAYLTAWHGEDSWRVLDFLAPGAMALTRSGIVEDSALEALVDATVPRLRIDAATLYLVDASDGWVTVGTSLQMESGVDEDVEQIVGSHTTVWERGPDLQWRVVFLVALWIDQEEILGVRRMFSPTGL
jgi:hypothetical protein